LKIAITLFILLFFVGIALATTVDTEMNVNGTYSQLDMTFINEEIISIQHFEINGTGYVRVTYNDGSERIQTLEDYIHEHESQWSQTGGDGLDLYSLTKFFGHVADWVTGKDREPIISYAEEIYYQLRRIFATKYDLWHIQQIINSQNLRIEALEIVVEKNYAKGYCDAKIELMNKYNLTSVNCGNTTYYPVLGGIGITPL